jgi:hypothetical protein
VHPHDSGADNTLFNIFVDLKFTVFVTPLFTKPFDRAGRHNLPACLSHVCNAINSAAT